MNKSTATEVLVRLADALHVLAGVARRAGEGQRGAAESLAQFLSRDGHAVTVWAVGVANAVALVSGEEV